MNRDSTLSMLGVPKAQRNQIDTQYPGGLVQFVQDCVESVFAKLPLQDNYFWRVYITGSYTPECCPEYLRDHNFQRLKQGLADRISVHTNSVQGFLERFQGEHFPLCLARPYGLALGQLLPFAGGRVASHPGSRRGGGSGDLAKWRSANRLTSIASSSMSTAHFASFPNLLLPTTASWPRSCTKKIACTPTAASTLPIWRLESRGGRVDDRPGRLLFVC